MTKIEQLAQAIAKAEGFFVEGSLPQRCHNPGDLELGDIGHGVDNGKTIYASDQEGWSALERECELILTGESKVYDLEMTILTVAHLYTGGDSWQPWASNVSSELGVSPSDTLEFFLNKGISVG